MDQDDPEQRIVELERELAQQKRAAEMDRQLAHAKAAARDDHSAARQAQAPAARTVAGHGAVDEHARRLAQALLLERERRWAQWRRRWQTDQPSLPEVAQLRESLRRAVVDAGLSQEQYKNTLQRAGLRAGGSVKVGGHVVYQRCDPSDPVYLAPRGRQTVGVREFGYGRQAGFEGPRHKLAGANRFGAIFGAIGGAIGLCVGGAAALTALIPSSALWMSGIVCISSYHLAYNTSHYSYQPGQSGTSVDFQCVNGDSSYDVNDFAIFGLQSVLAAFVLCVGLAGIGLIRARLREPR